MSDLLFQEFRDEQLESRYPFADTASLSTTSGLTLDPALFLDASIYPVGLSVGGQITQVLIAPREITLVVGDNFTPVLAIAVFDPTVSPSVLVLKDQYGRASGQLLADPLLLTGLGTWPVGTHKFATGAAEFVASLCIPSPQACVQGLLTGSGDFLNNDVWLVGADGVVFREIDGSIRVDVVGDPLFARTLCSPINLFTTPLFVQTINGQSADQYGNFEFTVGTRRAQDTILRVYPTGSGLMIAAVGPTTKG